MVKQQHAETLALIEAFLSHDEAIALVKSSIAAQYPLEEVEQQQQQLRYSRPRVEAEAADPLQP
jgi:hypothetical protein